MALRKVPLVSGEYYHILNRGVAKMQIFNSLRDYERFFRTMQYYKIDSDKPKFSAFSPNTFNIDSTKRTVEITAYCFMPNHFHFLLKQVKDKGITEFMSKLCNSYAKYFNIKNERVGPLLQGDFKAIHIDDNEQLLQLARYIHLNPLVGFITKDLETYKWSSYPEYVSSNEGGICEKDIILSQFDNKNSYKQFVMDHIDYAKKLEHIKHLLIDSESHSGWE